MRERLNLLERRLEKESIVSERMLRRAMDNKAAGLRRRTRMLMVIILLTIPYTTWTFTRIGLSPLITAVTCLFLLAAFFFDRHTYRLLRQADFVTGNLIQASRNVLRVKRICARWQRFAIPFVAVWFIWIAAEGYQNAADNRELLIGLYSSMGCGGLLGGLLGFRLYKKTQRAISDILGNIREITGTAP